MQFHPGKCQVIQITRNRTPIRHDYILHGHILESVHSAKYLGVTLTSDLRWNQHIGNITQKANRTLGFLRRNLQVKSPELKTTAYNTLVRPLVEYASPVWDPHTKTNIHKLEMVQRRAARYVLRKYNHTSSVGDMLDQLGWLTLQRRREMARLVLLYKMRNGLIAINGEAYTTPISRPSRHVHQYGYQIPHSKAEFHSQSFFPRTIRQWNSLPFQIVAATTPDSFRSQLVSLYQNSN